MSIFETAFAVVVGVEGGYDASAHDPGNWTGGAVGRGVLRGTKFGISAAAYPSLDVDGLTLDQARVLYRAGYWNPLCGDLLPAPVAMIAFDCAVNQGVSAARIILQQAADVAVDGAIGPVTVAAVNRASPAALVVDIAARRALRYAQGDMAAYGLGWMRRLITVAQQAFKL